MPEWMTVAQLCAIGSLSELGRNVCQSTAGPIRVGIRTNINNLRGQRARAGLRLPWHIGRTCQRLHPVVARTSYRQLSATVAEEGRTVLFSSHLLDEVERVADGC